MLNYLQINCRKKVQCTAFYYLYISEENVWVCLKSTLSVKLIWWSESLKCSKYEKKNHEGGNFLCSFWFTWIHTEGGSVLPDSIS